MTASWPPPEKLPSPERRFQILQEAILNDRALRRLDWRVLSEFMRAADAGEPYLTASRLAARMGVEVSGVARPLRRLCGSTATHDCLRDGTAPTRAYLRVVARGGGPRGVGNVYGLVP